MLHMRIVVPSYQAEHVLELLECSSSVINLIFLERAAHKPPGDVILCDVAREDASVIVSDLRELDVDVEGSISIEAVDSTISAAAAAAERAAPGLAGDAVVWEEVEARTSENIELSANYLVFFAIACLIASVGIMLDSSILIVGAMIVGPEFGAIAGLCVALVQRRGEVARRSFTALAVGFPVGITAAYLFALVIRAVDLTPDGFLGSPTELTEFIADPDAFSFIVAAFAGIAGVLSLTAAKSGALIGVLVSVTTIPAAAYIGVAAAYADWSEWRGAILQLAINLAAILVAGVLTLFVERLIYVRRRRMHLRDSSREAAGLPLGHSRRDPNPGRRKPEPTPVASALRDLAILVAAFAATAAIATALGAANLGTALGIAELVFVAVLMWILLRPG